MYFSFVARIGLCCLFCNRYCIIKFLFDRNFEMIILVKKLMQSLGFHSFGREVTLSNQIAAYLRSTTPFVILLCYYKLD